MDNETSLRQYLSEVKILTEEVSRSVQAGENQADAISMAIDCNEWLMQASSALRVIWHSNHTEEAYDQLQETSKVLPEGWWNFITLWATKCLHLDVQAVYEATKEDPEGETEVLFDAPEN